MEECLIKFELNPRLCECRSEIVTIAGNIWLYEFVWLFINATVETAPHMHTKRVVMVVKFNNRNHAKSNKVNSISHSTRLPRLQESLRLPTYCWKGSSILYLVAFFIPQFCISRIVILSRTQKCGFFYTGSSSLHEVLKGSNKSLLLVVLVE